MPILGTPVAPTPKHSPGAGPSTFTSAFTPATGDVVLAVSFCGAGSVFTAISVTVGGVSAVGKVTTFNSVAGSGNEQVWLGTVRGVATGAAVNVVVTWSGGSSPLSLFVVLADLTNWDGTIGVTPAAGFGNAASTTGPSVAGTLVGTGSLLIGHCGLGAVQTITTTGWSQTVVTDGTSDRVVFITKTGGAAGTTETLAPTSGGNGKWGVGWMELTALPARPPALLVPDFLAACAFQSITFGV